MNTIEELMGNGIGRLTAERMLSDYSSRVGTRSGIYEVVDINYDFHSHGKVVKLKCTECGRELSRVMISGRNKWGELIKTCPCEKNKKFDEQEAISKNFKKQKSLFIHGRRGVIMPRYSNDSKESTIKLRVNDDMRKYVEKRAKEKTITISEYIRELIRKDILDSKNKKGC